MKRIHVGIIGGTHGMGRWFAGLLRKEDCVVRVCGRKTRLQIDDLVKQCSVIVVAVPISVTAEIIKKVGPQMTRNQLLMDLTSLKTEPVKLMMENSTAEVIGCHPLFGPQLKEAEGQNVILCPARGKKWLGWLRNVLRKNKLRVWETSPSRHDEMMAVIQVLNHLNTLTLGLSLACADMNFEEMGRFSTPIFRAKWGIIDKVFVESPNLYLDIITGNPHTSKMLDLYAKALYQINEAVKSGDKNQLKRIMHKTAGKLYGRKNQ
jgi:prephenate dehydrogenase